jgi:hypothetical protein
MSQENSSNASPQPEFSESDIINAIQSVAERVDGPLRYHDYCNRRDEAHPSGPLIISRIRWSEACNKAAVETNGPRNEPDFTQEDCVAAVSYAIAERGQRISSSEYEAWSEGRRDVPSLTTVKNRLNGWQNAHDEAFNQLSL